MASVASKLKDLRSKAEPRLSVRKLAELLEMPPSSYAAYEDPSKFKKPIIPLDLAKSIAEALEPRGIERAEVLRLAGVTGDLLRQVGLQAPQDEDEEWLLVRGEVAAGLWRQATDWSPSEQYEVKFGRSEFPKSQRFAVKMEGPSMNRTIQSGADLECLWVKFSPTPPKDGDLVIVERTSHDLVEVTCKRLAERDGNFSLLCESYDEEFQDPLFIGAPDGDSFTDEHVRIVGIVLSAKLNLAPKDLRQRRYVRQ